MGKAHKSQGGMNVLISIITALLMLGLIGGLVVWLAREDGLTVYAEYAEKRYSVNAVNASLGKFEKGSYSFSVGSLTGESVDFSVDIVANSETSFTFTSNQKSYKWANISCLTFFDVQVHDKGFTITVTDNDNLTKLLQSQYGDFQYRNAMPDFNDFFVIIVKTTNGNISMKFALDVGEKPYTAELLPPEITLTPDHIVF